MHQSFTRQPLVMMLATFTLGLTMLGMSAWAGPYLRIANEDSKARKPGECQSLAAKAMHSIAQSSPMRVDQKNSRFGSTESTSIYVECIFVGRDEQKRDRWIYYVSVSSTNLKEADQLLNIVRSKLRKMSPLG
jgi:hypothetical protein